MGVPQFTTPTFTLTFSEQGLDLTQAANVYVTFKSGVNTITKTGESLTVAAKSISVHLAQNETAKFTDRVLIQANWTMDGGDRAASNVVEYNISTQLLKKVVE